MTYTQPLVLIGLLVTFAGLLRRKSRRLAFAGLLGLFLISWPPVVWLLSRPLQAAYSVRPFSADPPPQAIVVLSAGVSPPHFERPYPLLDANSFERCNYAAWIARQWPGIPVLASGGGETSQSPPFSDAMRQFLLLQVAPATPVWTEEQSHNTYENALYSAAILRQHGIHTIALVVDANSMPRAAACFRKQGMTVLPAPCRFLEFGRLSEALLPGWKAIQQNEDALHEVLGLLWYRACGRI